MWTPHPVPLKRCVGTLWQGTMWSIPLVAGVLFALRLQWELHSPPAIVGAAYRELMHRSLCMFFQVIWIAARSIAVRQRALQMGACRWMGDMIVGYFIFDLVGMATYAVRGIPVYAAHHAVTTALIWSVYNDRRAAAHLTVLGICLEFINPFINLSWILAHCAADDALPAIVHRWAMRTLGAVVLVLFVVTRFGLVLWLWWRSPTPWLFGGTAFFLVLSVVWFRRLCRYYLRGAAAPIVARPGAGIGDGVAVRD